jgi:very-short-patch-repair endonuclease
MKVFNTKDTREKRKILRCDSTPAEQILWDKLRNRQINGLKFFRQYGIGGYIVDFYCPKKRLVIELDGKQHFTAPKREYDLDRQQFMECMGIVTIRFKNREIENKIEDVLRSIEKILTDSNNFPKTPSLVKRGIKAKSVVL